MTDRLNCPCPYCHQECRVGMTHDCEARNYSEVKIVRLTNGTVVAQLLGQTE